MAEEERGVYVGDVNCILTFEDEQGREWLAAAIIGELVRYDVEHVVEQIPVMAIKDRAFRLREIKLVER